MMLRRTSMYLICWRALNHWMLVLILVMLGIVVAGVVVAGVILLIVVVRIVMLIVVLVVLLVVVLVVVIIVVVLTLNQNTHQQYYKHKSQSHDDLLMQRETIRQRFQETAAIESFWRLDNNKNAKSPLFIQSQPGEVQRKRVGPVTNGGIWADV
jgi:hypothetical protein